MPKQTDLRNIAYKAANSIQSAILGFASRVGGQGKKAKERKAPARKGKLLLSTEKEEMTAWEAPGATRGIKELYIGKGLGRIPVRTKCLASDIGSHCGFVSVNTFSFMRDFSLSTFYSVLPSPEHCGCLFCATAASVPALCLLLTMCPAALCHFCTQVPS